MLHAVIPMAGEGSRFISAGCNLPKPLVLLQGRPFFYWSASALTKCLPLASLTFVVLRSHIESHAIDVVIRSFFPLSRIVILERVANGPVLTCLASIDCVTDDLPVLFNDCDHLFHSQALVRWVHSGRAASAECGGSLISFRSDDPAYSYLSEMSPGNVASTVEKQVVGRHAICGAYLFRNRTVFAAAARHYIEHCSYNELFMSGVYNSLLALGHSVKHMPLDLHLSFGTPEELTAVADHSLLSFYRDQ